MAQVIIEVKKGGVCNCQQVQTPTTKANTMTQEDLAKGYYTISPAALHQAASQQPVVQNAPAETYNAATAPTTKAKIKWWPWLAGALGVVLVAVAVSGGKKKKDKDNKRKRK